MNRKKVLIAVALAALLVLAGCEGTESGPSGEKLGKDAGQNVSNVNVGESYWFEVKLTEKNQHNLVTTRPPFTMDDSLERQNLIKRYKYLNDQNNVHHVYLMSNDGKVVSYYTAQGKVSSVNSKLTNDRQIVKVQNCRWDGGNGAGGSDGDCYKTVESPQMDGSYGTNGAAIFFFTTDGHYVEWNGKYLVSEEPKQIQTAITLVEVDDQNRDVSGNETG